MHSTGRTKTIAIVRSAAAPCTVPRAVTVGKEITMVVKLDVVIATTTRHAMRTVLTTIRTVAYSAAQP